MKVLYIFDKYLNRTMNWAHRIMVYTPGLVPVVASPLIVKNEFYEKDWQFIFSPFQWENPKDEWSFSFLQVKSAAITVKVPFLYKRFLRQKIKEIKPDVIHIHFGTVAWEYSYLIEQLNIPLIATFHGYDYRLVLKNKPIFYKRYKDLFQRAKMVTCGGSQARKYLISLGCPEYKTRLIPMSVETDKIYFPTRRKKSGELNILQVSSFTEKKGQIYTLKAFNKALKINPHLKLTFIGEFVEDNILNEINAFIKKHFLEKHVTVIGSIPYIELLQKLTEFDIFMHPSITPKNEDIECTPVSIMDAQSAGLPVIATLHSDIPDIVVHKKTGILTEEKDVEGLKNAILKFVKMDEEEIGIWRKNARKYIEEKFDTSQVKTQWAQLYNEIKNQDKND